MDDRTFRNVEEAAARYPELRADMIRYAPDRPPRLARNLTLAAGLLLGLAVSGLFWPSPAPAAVRVIDGDTLDLNGTRIRLYGIDAPERAQNCRDAEGQLYPCGRYATLALRDLVARLPITCEALDTDRYGRTVARCWTEAPRVFLLGAVPQYRAERSDLGAALVSAGWAVAYRRYSSDYVPAEVEAQQQRRGIWAGTFTAPAEFRQRK